MKRLLEKWECLNIKCHKSFIVDKLLAHKKQLYCPFCKEESIAIAYQDRDTDIEDQLDGCLYPK